MSPRRSTELGAWLFSSTVRIRGVRGHGDAASAPPPGDPQCVHRQVARGDGDGLIHRGSTGSIYIGEEPSRQASPFIGDKIRQSLNVC
jgi:hypothetical protein